MRATRSIGPGVSSLTIKTPLSGYVTVTVNRDVLYDGRATERFKALWARWIGYWNDGVEWAEIRRRERKLGAWPKEWS